MTAIPAADAANTSARTTLSARLSQWPRIQLRTPAMSAASAARANVRAPAIFAICMRPERSRSARSHDSGTWTKRPALVISSPETVTSIRASPSLPTSTRGSENTNDQSVRAGRSFSSAATRINAAGSAPKCSRTCRSARARAASLDESRPRSRLGQHMPHLAHRAVRLDRHPPLLGARGDVPFEHRVAHLPERRRERRSDQRTVGAAGPPRAIRTCVASTGVRRSPGAASRSGAIRVRA